MNMIFQMSVKEVFKTGFEADRKCSVIGPAVSGFAEISYCWGMTDSWEALDPGSPKPLCS